MNKRQQHINDLLQRWVNGEVDRRDEQQLEQLSQEDPFLAEALEGYRSIPDDPHRENLDRIKEQFEEKYRSGSRRALHIPYRAVAAALILIAALAAVWYLLPTAGDALSQTETTPTTEETITRTAEEQPSPPQGQSGTLADGREEDSAEEELLDQSINPADIEAEVSPPAPPPPPPGTALVTPFPATDTADGNDNLAMTEGFSQSQPPPAEARSLSAPPQRRKISGQVVSSAGTPQPNVRVSVPGTTLRTVTDQQGRYEIMVDSASNMLEVSPTNGSPQRVRLPAKDDFVRVTLQAASQPSREETNATAKTDNKKPEPSINGAVLTPNLAEPAGGFNRFERYLRRNLRYPSSALEQGVSGPVVISFTVQPNGNVTGVQVVSGPGAGLHEEAVRLFIEGPRWKIINDDLEKAQVRYQINFSF